MNGTIPPPTLHAYWHALTLDLFVFSIFYNSNYLFINLFNIYAYICVIWQPVSFH
jgi:hypothetical protein